MCVCVCVCEWVEAKRNITHTHTHTHIHTHTHTRTAPGRRLVHEALPMAPCRRRKSAPQCPHGGVVKSYPLCVNILCESCGQERNARRNRKKHAHTSSSIIQRALSSLYLSLYLPLSLSLTHTHSHTHTHTLFLSTCLCGLVLFCAQR